MATNKQEFEAAVRRFNDVENAREAVDEFEMVVYFQGRSDMDDIFAGKEPSEARARKVERARKLVLDWFGY